jgi:hypothetical protein
VDQGEAQVVQLLKRYGLQAKKFDKRELGHGKTPDFRVFKDDQFVFFCEIKNPEEDKWLDRKLDEAPPGVIVGGGRPDPIYNRLTNRVHEAVKQFDAVNPDLNYPNVLVLMNSDIMSDFEDLIAVLTGHPPGLTDDSYPSFYEYSEGRIREEKFRIHLYIWIDVFRPAIKLFEVENTFKKNKVNSASLIQPIQIILNSSVSV